MVPLLSWVARDDSLWLAIGTDAAVSRTDTGAWGYSVCRWNRAEHRGGYATAREAMRAAEHALAKERV